MEEEGREKRGGGVLCLLSLPQAQTQKSSGVKTSQEKTGCLFFIIWWRQKWWHKRDLVQRKGGKGSDKCESDCEWTEVKVRGGDSRNTDSVIHTGRQNTAGRDSGAEGVILKVCEWRKRRDFWGCYVMTASLGMYSMCQIAWNRETFKTSHFSISFWPGRTVQTSVC